MEAKSIILLVLSLCLVGLLALSAQATINLISPGNTSWSKINFTQGLGFIYNYTGEWSTVNCSLWIDGTIANMSYAISNNTNFNASNSSYALGEGTHSWNVTCRNASGAYQENISAITLYSDYTNPGMFVNSPADTVWNNTASLTANFSFIDPYSQNASCVLYLNGVSSGTNSTVQNNTNTTITSVVTNGTKIWQVNCTDSAGNYNSTAIRTYYEDTTAPTVYLNGSSPIDFAVNSTANISVNISFIDAYSQNATCILYLDGSALATNSTTQNFTYTILSGVVGNGTHIWQVNCTDSGNNLGASSARTYYEDTVGPTIYLSTANNYFNNSATPALKFSFVDPGSPNATCTLYINGTATGTNTTVQNNTNTTITTNTSLNAGISIWQVNCSDAQYSTNSGTYYLTVDLTNPTPTISWINDLTVTADGTTNNTLRINFTASDTTFKNWTLSVYNSTPNLVATWNDTLANTSQVLSYSAVTNGSFQVNFTVWDNSSRVNVTSWTVYVDQNNNPAILPINVSDYRTTGAYITTSSSDSYSAVDFCNYSGAGSGNLTAGSGGAYTVNLSGLTSSTAYTVAITCYDLAGNNNATTTTFQTYATSSSSSSSSSGGGNSGATTSSVSGQFEQKNWPTLSTGETASVEPTADGMVVTKVEFKATTNLYGGWVKISKVEKADLPTGTTAFANKAYQYLEIKKNDLVFKEGTFSSAKVSVKVEKSWLDSNKVDKYNMAVFRYADNKWAELTTTYDKEDSKYVYYTASTPGFSYFLVGQKAAATAPAAKTETPLTPPAVTETAPETAAETTAATEETATKTPFWLWIVAIIAIIVIVVGLVLWKKK